MRLPLKQSDWLHVKDGYCRMFLRWLYARYLNELYLPRGTVATVLPPDNGRVPARPKQNALKLRAPGKGMQEAYLFEEFGGFNMP